MSVINIIFYFNLPLSLCKIPKKNPRLLVLMPISRVHEDCPQY